MCIGLWMGRHFRRYLVEPAAMYNLVQVSLFRELHDKEERSKNEMTRNRFFLISFLCSFAYYVFPGYLFPMLSSLSWLCCLFPASVLPNSWVLDFMVLELVPLDSTGRVYPLISEVH